MTWGSSPDLAQRVLVMYGGYIIEEAPVKESVRQPTASLHHRACWAACPALDSTTHQRLFSIEGMPPVLFEETTYLSICTTLQVCDGTLLERKSRPWRRLLPNIAWPAGWIPKPGVSRS